MTTSDWHTIGRWLGESARRHPERVAIDDRGVSLSYADLDGRAQRLADALVTAGYRRGDRVATVTGNSADHVVALFACARAGLVLTPLSWRMPAPELAEQLALADPALVLADAEFIDLARAAVGRLEARVGLTLLGESGVEHAVPAPASTEPLGEPGPGPVADGDPLLLTFTSGTSARPKGVLLSHASCFWTNLSLSRVIPLSADDVVLAVMPQFHAGGWNIQPLLAWATGATVVLERTFEPGRVLRLVAERRVTTMMGVPSHYLFLAEHPAFARTDLSSLRLAVVGGAPMPAEQLRTWHDRGVALVQGYGLSEAGPNVLCVPAQDARHRAGWAGLPYPGVEVALADPETGRQLHEPGIGELLVRGPGLFSGYFRDPQATARVLRSGWLHTGDLAERDATGYLRIVDRISDMFISGGENVSPSQVEATLQAHPAVLEAAVRGVPHPRWGEVGQAHVVLREGARASAEELIEHCRVRLARYKVPQRVVIVDELPRTDAGKIRRRDLPILEAHA